MGQASVLAVGGNIGPSWFNLCTYNKTTFFKNRFQCVLVPLLGLWQIYRRVNSCRMLMQFRKRARHKTKTDILCANFTVILPNFKPETPRKRNKKGLRVFKNIVNSEIYSSMDKNFGMLREPIRMLLSTVDQFRQLQLPRLLMLEINQWDQPRWKRNHLK